jgi:hypothetical protein
MKTIKQIADEIGVTKQAVFYRIKRPPLSNALRSLALKKDGVLMVENAGETLIKQAFSENPAKVFADKEAAKKNATFDGEIIKLLRDNITLLQDQLRIKDEQLAAAQEALKAEQILHADTKKIFLLPAPTESPTPPRGFFGRIFGRKKPMPVNNE